MSARGRQSERQATHQNSHQERTIARLRCKYGVKDLRQLYRETVARVLKLTSGDKMLTAELLGIGKTTLYRLTRPPGYRKRTRSPSRSDAEIKRTVQQLRRRFGFKTRRELLHDAIHRVLKITGGNRQLTAALLGIAKTTIYRLSREPVARYPEANKYRIAA